MGKKILKTKEPIKIRFKKLANGSKSVYLDYYQDGKRQYHFLKLYLNPQKDPITKAENEKVLQVAEKVKAEIYLQLVGNGGDLKTNFKKDKCLLLDYVKEIADSKEGNTKTGYMMFHKTLIEYAGQNVLLKDVNKAFCLGFVDYLKARGTLNKNSIRLYVDRFKACLNVAKHQKKIKENPFDEFLRVEMPQREDAEREYLTEAEIKKLAETNFIQRTKEAYLFCCFTGLRFSDVKTLEWGDIVKENGKMFLLKRIVKTRQMIKVPLNDNAIKLLPPQRKDTNKVFNLPTLQNANLALRDGARKAGINKHLSFHTSRHTYATLLLTKGVDLYNVSKLLGHKGVGTTQIYAKVIDQKKIEAVELLNGII